MIDLHKHRYVLHFSDFYEQSVNNSALWRIGVYASAIGQTSQVDTFRMVPRVFRLSIRSFK